MENSKIEWTHHTFNPWWGCVKVSPGCEHCYAETFSKRTGHNIWGPAKSTQRRLFGDKHWQEPLKWNQAAKEAGQRHRVFCASMADVFEDHPQVEESRTRLLDLIVNTPRLDWLLLTKRPENVNRMIEQATGFSESSMWFHAASNVWIGTSVENQEAADKRIPELLRIPAKIRFLSCEPLLGPVDLFHVGTEDWDVLHGWKAHASNGRGWANTPFIHWVIVGGESGHRARLMHPDWARSLRDQCQRADIPFFFKQWGEYSERGTKVGKKAAGRLLDGREWSQFPTSQLQIA